MTTPTELRESFTSRNRRAIGLTLWLGAAAAIVLLYFVTKPGPQSVATPQGGTRADVPTIQVGALPVT